MSSRSWSKVHGEAVRHPGRVIAVLICIVVVLYVRNAVVGCSMLRAKSSSPPAQQQEQEQKQGMVVADLDTWLLENGLAGRGVVKEKRLKVAVVNSVSWHNEVVFWLVYTLRLVPNLDLTLYTFWKKYGSEEFLKKIDRPQKFQMLRTSRFQASDSAGKNPDAVFLTTCGKDMINVGATVTRMLELNPSLRVICVVHHPELILNNTEALLPFAKAKALTFLSLAPHVASFVQSDIIPELVHHSLLFAPVPSVYAPATFLYEPKSPCPRDMSEIHPATFPENTNCFSDFVIQGMVEFQRRNYTRVFEGLNGKLKKRPADWRTFHLNLMGASETGITFPKPVDKKLRFFNGLEYEGFYERMHHNAALLPAFASGVYYLNVSSSSVAAALIAGVPVVGDEKFLQAYSFFEEDAIYMQKVGETEADTMERIRGLSMAEVVEKRRKLAALNIRLIAKNVLHFRSLIREGWSSA